MHPEAVLIRGIATGPPPPPEGGGGVSSWQTEGRTAGVSAFAIAKAWGSGGRRGSAQARAVMIFLVFLEVLERLLAFCPL